MKGPLKEGNTRHGFLGHFLPRPPRQSALADGRLAVAAMAATILVQGFGISHRWFFPSPANQSKNPPKCKVHGHEHHKTTSNACTDNKNVVFMNTPRVCMANSSVEPKLLAFKAYN
eukprot:221718-Amphidinium_carterae.1